jgi:hypothetical protein
MFLQAAIPVIQQLADLFDDLITWFYDDLGSPGAWGSS